MVDITLNEMKDVLRDLGGHLNNTSGDRSTLSKLEEIRKILDNVQKLTLKNDPKVLGQVIGKSITDVLSLKLIAPQRTTATQNVNVNLIDDNVRLARREVVNELYSLSAAFRKTSAGLANFKFPTGVGGGGALPRVGNDFEGLVGATSKLTKIAAVVSAVATGIVDVATLIKTVLMNDVDVYRRLNDTGQTFNGSLFEMVNVATSSGESLGTFTKMLETGSSGLRQLGARDIASMTKSLQDSMRSMANMGMTTDQVNSAMSNYVEGLKYSGDLDRVKSATFNQSFQDMIVRTTDLSAAFGVGRDAIIKAAADIRKDPNTNALLLGLSREVADKYTEILAAEQAKTPAQADVTKAALSTAKGLPTVEFGQLSATYPKMMEMLANANKAFQEQRINDFEFQRQRQAAGKVGQQEAIDHGVEFLANVDTPAANAAKKGAVAADEYASETPQQQGKALTAPTPVAKEALEVDRSLELAKAALDKASNIGLETIQESITATLKNVNEAADKFVEPFVTSLDRASDHLNAFDTALADVITKLGPLGTLAAGAGIYTATNVAAVGASALVAKSALSKAGSLIRSVAGRGAVETGEVLEGSVGAGAAAEGAATGVVAEGAAATGTAVEGAGVVAGLAGGAEAGAAGAGLGATVAAPAIALAATTLATTWATKKLITEWAPLQSFVAAVDRTVPFLAKIDAATSMSAAGIPTTAQYGPLAPATPAGEQYGPTAPTTTGEQQGLPTLAPAEQYGPAAPPTTTGEQQGPPAPAPGETETPEQQMVTTLNQIFDMMNKQFQLSNQMHQETLDERALMNSIMRSIDDNTGNTVRNITNIGHVR